MVAVAVTGAHGNCSIPADATGISINLTITNPTAPGYLTLYPSGGSRPNASNINWVAGQAPTANQAVVGLNGGILDVFNYDGDVDVIIDIHGYYSPSGTPGAVPAPSARGRRVDGRAGRAGCGGVDGGPGIARACAGCRVSSSDRRRRTGWWRRSARRRR